MLQGRRIGLGIALSHTSGLDGMLKNAFRRSDVSLRHIHIHKFINQSINPSIHQVKLLGVRNKDVLRVLMGRHVPSTSTGRVCAGAVHNRSLIFHAAFRILTRHGSQRFTCKAEFHTARIPHHEGIRVQSPAAVSGCCAENTDAQQRNEAEAGFQSKGATLLETLNGIRSG